LFANRSEADILLREEIEETARNYPGRFKFMFTIDSAEGEWKYKTGHINKGLMSGIAFFYSFSSDMIAESLPAASEDTMILICGPPPMIKFACLPNLADLGHKDENVFCY
jgi:cytochrome-b5 reductase